MKEHFAQSLNETEHLEYMESRGGSAHFVDRAFARFSYLSIIGSTWFIIGWASVSAYHLSYEVEIHAAETYAKYLANNGPDEKNSRDSNDELEHSRELQHAMEIIK